jgi:hypothetical protein
MRRVCLGGILGLVALLTCPSAAVAQGWGLGIFAKWSGPEFRGYNLRATIGCWADTNISIERTTAIGPGLNLPFDRFVDPTPFRVITGRKSGLVQDNGAHIFLPIGQGRVTFTPEGQPENRITLGARASVCLEYEHSTLFNDDVERTGSITLNRDGVMVMWIPSHSDWLGQLVEIGGGGGMRWYRSDSTSFRDPYLSAQALVKPFGLIKSAKLVGTHITSSSLAPLKGIRLVLFSDWFPTVTNENFHLADPFDHKWQYGAAVAYDFTSLLFDR